MDFFKFSVTAFLLCLLISIPGYSKLTAQEKETLQSYITLVNKQSTFSDYVSAMNGKVTPEDLQVLKEISEKHQTEPAPHIVLAGPSTLEITSGKETLRIQIESLENETYIVNGKKLNLADAANMQERVERILRALPKRSTSAHSMIWQLFVPEAQAFVPLVAWGAWATWGMISASTVAAAGGAYYANQNQCKELGETLDSCNAQLGILEGYAAKYDTLAKQIFKIGPDGKKIKSDGSQKVDLENDTEEMTNLKLWIQYRQKKAKNSCPDFPVNQDLDRETSEIVKTARRISEQTTAKLARCQSSLKSNFQKAIHGEASTVHGLLLKCYKNISLVALDLCLPGASKIIKDHIQEDIDSGLEPTVSLTPTNAAAPAAPPPESSHKGRGGAR